MNSFKKVDIAIDPCESKLFSNDVFSFISEKNMVTIAHSSVRSTSNMPAVLIINGNKTYGRAKNGKLLYKCVPDDFRLPPFLVPYEIKNVGFSKVFINLYVTFNFVDWSDKHPIGVLTNVIGSVDVLDNFYEYQLYCKSLNASIQKFQKDTAKAIGKNDHEDFINSVKVKFPHIEDRTNIKDWYVFTIDPPKSQDFDDGFSIRDAEDGVQQLSIYIANVTIWLDILNLWDSFSQRISTIYLPDKKRPMLPTILSDCLCSLQEKVTRIAFVMDIFIKDNAIVSVKYGNCFIKVARNFCYEEASLLRNEKYNNLHDITKNMSKKNKYITHVKNSHDVVCYLMILMNYYCATEMLKHNTGVFRSTIMKRECMVPDSVPEEVSKYIKIWNSASGQYIDGSQIATSDRRLVDLLNMIKLQSVLCLITLSENVDKFYDKWLRELEYINVTMRSIRKVQCDCSLLDLCANNVDIMEKEYDGYMFDKINRNDGLFQYIVFLPELKLSSRITLRDDFENFDCRKFKLFLFNDEESFKRKIRLHLV